MKYALRLCVPRVDSERYIAQMIKACRDAGVDEIMFCEDNVLIAPTSQPLSAHRENAEMLKGAVRAFRDAGFACSFYLKSLIGHVDTSLGMLPYTRFTGLNGTESLSECCLLDTGFRKYAAELMSCYAACGFDAMMLDDDFRSVNHAGGQIGCFCPLHVRETEKLYGKPLTREMLIAAVQNWDSESLRIRECFRRANYRGQKRFAAAVEKAIHRVDTNVRVGLMCSGIEADMFQGRNMRELLETLAGPDHRPYLRPPGGSYSDTQGINLFYGLMTAMKYRAYVGHDASYVSEVDVFYPRNVFAKSAAQLKAQIAMHVAAGYDAVSLNLFDHYGTPPSEGKEYWDVLKKGRAEFERIEAAVKDKVPAGVGFPVKKDYGEKLRSGVYGLFGRTDYDSVMFSLGIPVCAEEGDIIFLNAELMRCYTDGELKALLKKGVILDPWAVEEAEKRGLGEYIGVSVSGSVAEPCYEVLSNRAYHGRYAGDRFPVWQCPRNGKAPLLLKKKEDAEEITALADANLGKISPALTLYHNSLGGWVLCMATAFSRDNWWYKGRVVALPRILRKMKGGELPFHMENAYSVASIYYKGSDEDAVILFNYGQDTQRVTIHQPQEKHMLTIRPLELRVLTLRKA